MIFVFKSNATKKQIHHVVEKIKELGLKPMVSSGIERADGRGLADAVADAQPGQAVRF